MEEGLRRDEAPVLVGCFKNLTEKCMPLSMLWTLPVCDEVRLMWLRKLTVEGLPNLSNWFCLNGPTNV